ncbi:MAG: TonB family protein [Gemmatimonadetes bacterium]|nr:energy transducer TonB [Gemmatimonadota bacterium]NNM04314.1 TonB family protein [Gemmatimonadota bacterium]
MRDLRHTFLAGAAAFLLGCASSGGGGTDSCRSALHRHPVSLNSVLDSVRLQRELGAQWSGGSGLTLASVSFDSAADSVSVQVYSEWASQSFRESVVSKIRGAITDDLSDTPSFGLVVAEGPDPAVRRVEGFRRCAPVVLEERDTERRIESEVERLGVSQRQIVRLQLSILADGTVATVRVVGSSGNTNVDLAASRVFQTARFTPARIEGISIPVWITLPVTFSPRSRTP